MRPRQLAVAAILTGLLLHAGCSPDRQQASPGSPKSSVTRAEVTRPSFLPVDPPLPEPPAPAAVPLRRTFTRSDGLQIAVVKVERRPLSKYAAGGSRTSHDNLLLTVKLTASRQASAALNPLVTLRYGTRLNGRDADGRDAEQVADFTAEGQPIGDGFGIDPGRLRRGRSRTGTWGFAVPKHRKVEIQFSFNLRNEDGEVIFVGRA
jgi:hypothetical protein